MMVIGYGFAGLALLVAASILFTTAYAWWIERSYPPTGHFVTVAGGRLHYIDRPAEGEVLGTVVLLHGASSNLEEMMLGIGSRLSSRYRIVAFDRPGHGWSDRIADPDAAKPARQAALLAEGMRKLGVGKAVVVGHSWSGSIIPNLALDHRDVTGALLDLSGVTHPWPGAKISWYYTLSTSWLGWVFTRTITTPVGLLLFRPAAASSFAPQVMPSGFMEQARIPLIFRPGVFHTNAQDVGMLHASVAQQTHRYKDIAVPTTVIAGDADGIVWTDLHAHSFAQAVPGAKLIILPGIGHMPQYAKPDIVVAEIEALAAEVARAGARAAVP